MIGTTRPIGRTNHSEGVAVASDQGQPLARNRLRVAAISAGVVFAAGFTCMTLVPGGGNVTDRDFTDFYNSSGKRLTAYLLDFVLIVGCWLMIWLFTELRARLAASTRSEVAYRLAVGAAVMVMVGGAIDMGPAGAQLNSPGSAFVGVPVAHALAQAGLLTAITGTFTFAAAVFLLGLEFRRSAAFPNWLGVLSIVFAILLIGSFIVLPVILLPIWAIIVGIAGGRRRTAAAIPATP